MPSTSLTKQSIARFARLGLLLWNFLRKFLRRRLKVSALSCRVSTPPTITSFAQICPRLRSPSKALLGSLYSGTVYALGTCSSQLPSSSTHLCLRLFLWARRATHQFRSGSKVFVLAARSSRPAAHFAQHALVCANLVRRTTVRSSLVRFSHYATRSSRLS